MKFLVTLDNKILTAVLFNINVCMFLSKPAFFFRKLKVAEVIFVPCNFRAVTPGVSFNFCCTLESLSVGEKRGVFGEVMLLVVLIV